MVKICPTCKKFVPETAQKCPMCGNTKLVLANVPASTAAKISPTATNTKQAKKKRKSKAPVIVSLLIVLGIIAAVRFAIPTLNSFPKSNITANTPPRATQSTPAPTKEPEGLWEIRYYVDEFNRPTQEAYITNASFIRGTFSNSATTDSKLYVRFLIDEDDVSIKLYEYGDIEVKNSYSHYITYDITMLQADGTKKYLEGNMSSDRIKIRGEYYIFGESPRLLSNNIEDVINALKDEGEVSFYITQQDRRTTKYLFTVDTSNFAEVYQDLLSLSKK